ncbi:MAG: hypothetical protein ACK5K7_03500 [Bacilli bacterium]
MKKFLIAVLIFTIFNTSCFNTSKNLKNMGEMEEEFDNFKDNAIKNGYILSFNSSKSNSYDRFDIEINSNNTFQLIIEIDNSKAIFYCGDENNYKVEINKEVYSDNPEMVENMCKTENFQNLFDTTMQEVYNSGFFNEKYDVEYKKNENYYIASGVYDNGDKYELKIYIDAKNFYYHDENKTINIEVK